MGCCASKNQDKGGLIDYTSNVEPNNKDDFLNSNPHGVRASNATFLFSEHETITDLEKRTNKYKLYFSQEDLIKISNSDKLVLTIIDSKKVKVGSKVTINVLGIESSERKTYDGKSYFGKRTEDGELNDYYLPEESNVNNRHFEVKFDSSYKFYMIKGVDKAKLFIRISQKFMLKHNSILNFGTNNIKIEFRNSIADKDIHFSVIRIEGLEGVNKGKSM